MTLVDLPGLVRDEAVPPEEVDAVNGTIANYLVQDQTIILACLACDGDAHGWADVLGRARGPARDEARPLARVPPVRRGRDRRLLARERVPVAVAPARGPALAQLRGLRRARLGLGHRGRLRRRAVRRAVRLGRRGKQ